MPDWVLPVGGGLGYGDFVLDDRTRTTLIEAWSSLPDPVTRGAALVVLWENMLEGRIEPDRLLPDSLALERVTVLDFALDDRLLERIDAETAYLEDGQWRLANAWITHPNRSGSVFEPTYLRPANLSFPEIIESFSSPAAVSFWRLPRYIELLDSNITTFALGYQLTPKYRISLSQSFDFGRGDTVRSSVLVTRKFDRFFAGLRFHYNASENESGISFTVAPEGFGNAISSDGNIFGR